MKSAALEKLSTLYRDAVCRCGINWAQVEAEVQQQLAAMDRRERDALFNELTLLVAQPDETERPQ